MRSQKVKRKSRPKKKADLNADNQKGLVLIAVLWTVVLLMVIVTVVQRSSRLDVVVNNAMLERLRCRWALRAGIEKAIAVLNEDDRASDCLTDLWSDNDEDFNDIELQGCRFSVRVVDEAGKLNVNTASKEQLMQLDNMTEEIAGAIIDWRDKDDEQGPGGAELGYYQNLPYPYEIRNGPFKTIRELLMVKGVTEELLYGEDTNLNGQLDYNENDGDLSPPPDDEDGVLDKGWIAYLTCYSYERNVDAQGNKRVNINKADEKELRRSLRIKKSYAKWIVENRKKDGYKSIADLISESSPKKPRKGAKNGSDKAEPLDLQTFSRIADKITVNDEERIPGKVNVNTASKIVLAALLGEDDSADNIAEGIIAYRQGQLDGITSIAELIKARSVGLKAFKKLAPFITTRSDVYTIRCYATAERGGQSGFRLQSEAVVDRSSRPCRILYIYEGSPYYPAGERQVSSQEVQ